MNQLVKDEGSRFLDGKFNLSTPNFGSHDYCQILHPETGGVPLRNRIIRDVKKVFESMEVVQKYEGINIYGIGNRKGKSQGASCQ